MLARQSAEKQQIVEKRLEAIDAFLKSQLGGASDVDAAAAKVGLRRRQFYSLITKLRELGPARALTPGLRNVARAAPSREGLAPVVESAIQRVLANDPEAKITCVEAFVRQECEREGAEFPGSTAIRRRVHALRRSGVGAQTEKLLGARLTIDQSAVDLSVHIEGKDLLAITTLIIDRDTKLIAGCGVTALEFDGAGLREAMKDFSRRWWEFEEFNVTVAPAIAEMTFVIPPNSHCLVPHGRYLQTDRKPTFNVIEQRPRRHGEAILRLIGDRLISFPFRRLEKLDDGPLRANTKGVALEDARRLIQHSVDAWNERILKVLGPRALGQEDIKAEFERRNNFSFIRDDLMSIITEALDTNEEMKIMFGGDS